MWLVVCAKRALREVKRTSRRLRYTVLDLVADEINAMLNGEHPVIYGDGKQSRNFTYVANVVQANLLACDADGVTGELFNVACGERYIVLDLVIELNEILDKDVEPVFTEPRKGDVKHFQADISKAQRVLGYNPIVDFSEGLRETVR